MKIQKMVKKILSFIVINNTFLIRSDRWCPNRVYGPPGVHRTNYGIHEFCM